MPVSLAQLLGKASRTPESGTNIVSVVAPGGTQDGNRSLANLTNATTTSAVIRDHVATLAQLSDLVDSSLFKQMGIGLEEVSELALHLYTDALLTATGGDPRAVLDGDFLDKPSKQRFAEELVEMKSAAKIQVQEAQMEEARKLIGKKWKRAFDIPFVGSRVGNALCEWDFKRLSRSAFVDNNEFEPEFD